MSASVATAIYVLASLFPALLLGFSAVALRRSAKPFRLLVDLALMLVSIPIAAQVIGWALEFPENPGDHNPGIGIAFAPFILVWLLCLAIWLFRAAMFGLRERAR